jgi:hypothetical protein
VQLYDSDKSEEENSKYETGAGGGKSEKGAEEGKRNRCRALSGALFFGSVSNFVLFF